MQPLNWYLRRMKTMSPGEILWRLRSGARDRFDQGRFAAGILPTPKDPLTWADLHEPALRISDVETGAWRNAGDETRYVLWAERLKRRADRIALNRLRIFSLDDAFIGEPIAWNRDHESGKEAPLRFAPSIDYRDYTVTGDAKFVWEPNRHQHLVVLGRAYRAFGEERYAAAVASQLSSWLEQSPFGYGMNWRSPLELGIRLINWIWALDLLRGSAALSEELMTRVLESAYRHVWEIERKFSRGSSANNHLIGEAAAVFVAASFFPRLPGAGRLQAESRGILSREILRQTFGDGCTREQAMGYHLFVLQFFLVAGITARKTGEDFPPSYWERLEKMMEFAAAMAEGGPLPYFGDADDGYVLDLGGEGIDVRELLAVGALLFHRRDFKRIAGESGDAAEAAYWLMGAASLGRYDLLGEEDRTGAMRTKGFPESGYYLLQRGRSDHEDRASVLFDCGELGYTAIAAHGHADALAFTMRVAGRDLLVDPGTYDYFTYPAWRDYFRGTRSHNSVEIDGMDQSRILGPFLWGEKAVARCLRFETRGQGGVVTGEHDGYVRQGIPVRHRRTLDLDEGSCALTIRDEILLDALGTRKVRISFHFAETCRVRTGEAGGVIVEEGGRFFFLETDPALEISLLLAADVPPGGWVSRGYHRKVPSTTVVATASVGENTEFVCRIRLLEDGGHVG